jgi:hypothetical protein
MPVMNVYLVLLFEHLTHIHKAAVAHGARPREGD